MNQRLSAIAVSLFFVALALSAQEPQHHCSGTARECEGEIRSMLTGRRYLGLDVVELKPGIVVKSVVPDSPAERAEFKAGDRLMAVNGHATNASSVRDFKQILAQASNTGTLWVIVQRRGALKNIQVRLEPYTNVQIDKIIAQHLKLYHTPQASAEKKP